MDVIISDAVTAGGFSNYFKKRVLDPAVDMINGRTNLSVTYEGIKSGKKIESIVFTYIVEDDYIDGEIAMSKPLRPRMPSRSRVTKGSAAEGDWARRCIEVMKKYLTDLRSYDAKLKLSKADLVKVESWHKQTGKLMDEAFWYKNVKVQ